MTVLRGASVFLILCSLASGCAAPPKFPNDLSREALYIDAQSWEIAFSLEKLYAHYGWTMTRVEESTAYVESPEPGMLRRYRDEGETQSGNAVAVVVAHRPQRLAEVLLTVGGTAKESVEEHYRDTFLGFMRQYRGDKSVRFARAKSRLAQ